MTVIKFENVSKRYRIKEKRYHSLREDIAAFFGMINPFKKKQIKDEEAEYIWALKDVNFEIKDGESLGIIGSNGAGKTTILKLLSRITSPTQGTIFTNGKITSLIELGTGLHPELTGRENIYLYGSIMGMKREEIKKKFNTIVEFSELEKFIDTQVKYYSTGMVVRLGFSVISQVNSDILLIDEVLAVGDIAFQNKCLSKIREMKANGKSIVCVSHNFHIIGTLSTNIIWLNKGLIEDFGDPKKVIKSYLNYLEKTEKKKDKLKKLDPSKTTGEIMIEKVRILNSFGEETYLFQRGEEMIVEIIYKAKKSSLDISFGCAIYRTDDIYVYGTNTFNENLKIVSEEKGEIILRYNHLLLSKGEYEISVGIFYKDEWGLPYDYHDRYYNFAVETKQNDEGIIFLPHQWEIQS